MPLTYWATALATVVAVILCVILHHEGLRIINRSLPLPGYNVRWRVLFLIVSLLILHTTEIWIFGAGYYLLLTHVEPDGLTGSLPMSLLDCVYYSASVFTTLGFGDIVPKGALRFMTGTEAIAGLTLITWSASYTFLFMQKTWSFDDD